MCSTTIAEWFGSPPRASQTLAENWSEPIEPRFTDKEHNPPGPNPARRVFVGGYTGRVTPVPIPNTVVKPAGPMILLQRESRSLPALYEPPGRKARGFFFAYVRHEPTR